MKQKINNLPPPKQVVKKWPFPKSTVVLVKPVIKPPKPKKNLKDLPEALM